MRDRIPCPRMTILLLLIGLSGPAFPQRPELMFSKDMDVPNFFYDYIVQAAPDTGRCQLQVFTKIAYDELQFLKQDSLYTASYEVSITVFDRTGEQAEAKSAERRETVDRYLATNSATDFSLSVTDFDLKPGKYELLIGLMDLDSKKTGHRKTKIECPDFWADSLSISSLFLADRMTVDSAGTLNMTPNVMWNFGDGQSRLYLGFEIYNPAGLDSARVGYKILNPIGEAVQELHKTQALTDMKTQIVMEISRKDLQNRRYKLAVGVSSGSIVLTQSRDMTVRWMGMPAFATDLDRAIEQLSYIAKGKDIETMKKAGDREKSALFQQFWKNLDPTPGTEVNEIMEEYYKRIEYANATFSTFIDGWKSDRGMVYILLGAPNDVERHPFEADSKPYEIWYYHRYNRNFVFVDQTGFGEYRLTSPFWQVMDQLR
ncbi:GWxTD domain-containing protein [bacterium]|nr:GWxTD domain-containing protein [bacterium]